jgi:OmpA family
VPGPGQISMTRNGALAMSALLYNFEVGSWQLKDAHRTWIRSTLLGWTRIPDMRLVIVGLASRTGKDSSNLALSRRRAQAVSRELALAAHKMPEETLLYVGEKAAALVGMGDGVESDRWRAVWISLSDDRGPSAPAPVVFEQRRSRAVAFIKDSQKTLTGGEPGEAAYERAQGVRRSFINSGQSVISEDLIAVDRSFILTRIVVETTSQVSGIPLIAQYEAEYLVVNYEWGPWDGKSSRSVELVRKGALQPDGPPKDSSRTINPVVAEEWLKRPLWAFNNL